ncbi:hydroxyphenylacetyl-CoA thioesterase PaaI [Microbacterium sp. NPDC096154]|uniref:hydroxyphenylacetyl-CoA thioesterase PaaI n=1 Tax=Microbacterium sp. NPDC096154 TaxID=3155549 RepID=UPI0033322588
MTPDQLETEAQTLEDAIAPDPAWRATTMPATDYTKQHFGIDIVELEPGRAVLTMTVRDWMANGFGITHGGMVFTLADTAFAYACNEGADMVVAQAADITFLRATHVGDRLTATAVRRWIGGRNGIYDISVADAQGRAVAEFRGRSRAIPARPATATRSESDAPSETDAPSESDAPSETDAPSESDAPSETDAPSEADAPSETDKESR